MGEQGERFWSLAQELIEEIPKVHERHAQQMKKIAEMDGEMEMTKVKAEELSRILIDRNREIETSRTKVEDFSQQLAEKNKQIDDLARKAQALTELLWDKNKEIEAFRRKAESDIIQLEEAHKLETDSVRFQAQQTEAEYHRATIERLRRALQEKDARQSQLEKELLETRLMAGGNNVAKSSLKDPSALPVEMQKLQLQNNNLASESEESIGTSPLSRGAAEVSKSIQELQNKSGDDRERGRNLTLEFTESPLPDRVESYEMMKARESVEVEAADANNVQACNRDRRQALKQGDVKPQVLPLRRKQRFIR
ncbi:unnamed protein product [Calypogeia fissa]